jgi:hypothetical protein
MDKDRWTEVKTGRVGVPVSSAGHHLLRALDFAILAMLIFTAGVILAIALAMT